MDLQRIETAAVHLVVLAIAIRIAVATKLIVWQWHEIIIRSLHLNRWMMICKTDIPIGNRQNSELLKHSKIKPKKKNKTIKNKLPCPTWKQVFFHYHELIFCFVFFCFHICSIFGFPHIFQFSFLYFVTTKLCKRRVTESTHKHTDLSVNAIEHVQRKTAFKPMAFRWTQTIRRVWPKKNNPKEHRKQ